MGTPSAEYVQVQSKTTESCLYSTQLDFYTIQIALFFSLCRMQSSLFPIDTHYLDVSADDVNEMGPMIDEREIKHAALSDW